MAGAPHDDSRSDHVSPHSAPSADAHPDSEVRVGNPERERAIGLLNDAFAAGYLDVTEFEERSGAVYAGRTRGELRRVLVDLPSAPLLFPDDPPDLSAALGPNAVPAVPTPPSRAEWDIDWETMRRKGRWQVPASALVTGGWGTLDLDFSKASFTGPSFALELQVSVSTVKLRLGADQELRVADLERTGWSTVKDKSGPPRRPGGAVIVVSGSISGMSGVTIKRE